MPPLLKIERNTSYITPSGRVCRWLPPGDSAEASHELSFVYIDTQMVGDTFQLQAAVAQRVLKARPRLLVPGVQA